MRKQIEHLVELNRAGCSQLSETFPRFFYTPSYVQELRNRIDSSLAKGKQSVLEVGGIDRPLLRRGKGFRYVGMDIESREACAHIYDDFIVQSVESPISAKFDVIISLTLLEHVRDNTKSIASMRDALNARGETHHYVPSKLHPYAVILRLVGPTLQRKLIAVLRPEAANITGYPAFFHRCSISEMTKTLTRAGFVDVYVKPYYRANDYFAFFLPAFVAVTLFENICQYFNLGIFASGFVFSARVE